MVNVLRNSSIFGDVGDEAIEYLSGMEWEPYQASRGEVLLKYDEQVPLTIVHAWISDKDYVDDEEIVVNDYRLGDIVEPITRNPFSTEVEREGTIYLLGQRQTRIVMAVPEFAQRLMDHVTNRQKESYKRIRVAYGDSRQRVAYWLASHISSNGITAVYATQGEIADRCGVTRETVNKALSHMQSDGIVELQRGKIKVLDGEKLADIAPI